ncbi:MAG TPA: hypothetical protein VJT09_17015 [Pyrinomonadaceae bacterium]|nr:hypothetical protein [Pyrinomonadaceae bacterium]
MTSRVRFSTVVVCAMMLMSVTTLAQTIDSRQTNSTSQAQEQPPKLPPNATSLDVVANELGLLRKSLQTLNVRLREISERVLGTEAGQGGASNDKQNRIALNLDVLTRAEQRAEVLRKLLLELIEKETAIRSRLVQLEEDMRPESIERAMASMGSTRTVELRDARRRVLENERRGFDSLLSQTAQSRVRLEDDVKQADSLVFRLRQRLFPAIDKEIEKITPN